MKNKQLLKGVALHGKSWGLALASTFVLTLAAAPSLAEQSTKQPNIIYILADDLGIGDIEPYGQDKIKTPNLTQMAQEGIRFTQHYAGSTVCGPSRAVLMTGLHTGHGPIRGNPLWTASGKPVSLKAEDITIAEMLKEAGYTTAAIGKWGLSEDTTIPDHVIDPAMPNQQGFDYFFGYKFHTDAHSHYWNKMWKNNSPYYLSSNDPEKATGQFIHDLFTQEALSYLNNARQEKPFFLYLAYTLPHLPISVPDDSKEQYKGLGWPVHKMNRTGHYKNDLDRNLAYAGMVSRMDRDIGELFATLKRKGLDKNTLVIFASDNGPVLGNGFFDSNGAFKGRKRDLYDGGVRVPMIVRWPGMVKANTESNHISAFWDIMPTFCELAKSSSCPKNDGLSMLPTLLGQPEKQKEHDYLYWEFNERQGPVQAVRSGDWKVVKRYKKKPELYNIVNDLGEKKNLWDKHPEIAKRLMNYLQTTRTEHSEFPLKKMGKRE